MSFDLGNDARFASGEFQKFQQKIPEPNGKNISIHYQYNDITGQVVDVKVTSSLKESQ